MKRKYLISAMLLFITIILTSCKENNPPGSITLITPLNNATCIQGISASNTTSLVKFTWSDATNVESYQIVIKNLTLQSSINYTTIYTSYTATLNTNTSYSWYVVAKNSSGNSTSDTWKLYLTGTPTSDYAPFPAGLTAPASGSTINSNSAATVEVTFQWIGNDPDNDIASYTLYLDNTNASTQVVASLTATSVTQNIARGKTYFWKVVTANKVGNISTSAVSTFSIN
ncbi:MAG: hypothetical protein PHT07_14370 [Paludibacter sp.]|nr:hypothetical protein [Paludibacter sp.]